MYIQSFTTAYLATAEVDLFWGLLYTNDEWSAPIQYSIQLQPERNAKWMYFEPPCIRIYLISIEAAGASFHITYWVNRYWKYISYLSAQMIAIGGIACVYIGNDMMVISI